MRFFAATELILSVAADDQPLRSDPSRRYASLVEMNNDVTNPLWTYRSPHDHGCRSGLGPDDLGP